MARTRACLTVEQINAQIQISGEGHPQQIWNLQQRRCFIDFRECDYHGENQHPQNNKPDKREQICLHVKENQAPNKIKNQLDCVKNKGFCFIPVI